MASLDEAFEKVVDDSEKAKMERTFQSLLKERETYIQPFTQKQNESNGHFFIDKNVNPFQEKKA